MRTIIAAACLALSAAPSQARGRAAAKSPDAPDPVAMAERRLERLRTELDLTEDQAQKISAVLARSEGESAGLVAKLRDVQRREDRDIRAALSAAQKTKFDEVSRRRPRAAARRETAVVSEPPSGAEEAASAAPAVPPAERPDHPGVMIDTGDDDKPKPAPAAKPKIKRKPRGKKKPAAAPSPDAPPPGSPSAGAPSRGETPAPNQ